jgi:hypothetical protein
MALAFIPSAKADGNEHCQVLAHPYRRSIFNYPLLIIKRNFDLPGFFYKGKVNFNRNQY